METPHTVPGTAMLRDQPAHRFPGQGGRYVLQPCPHRECPCLVCVSHALGGELLARRAWSLVGRAEQGARLSSLALPASVKHASVVTFPVQPLPLNPCPLVIPCHFHLAPSLCLPFFDPLWDTPHVFLLWPTPASVVVTWDAVGCHSKLPPCLHVSPFFPTDVRILRQG